MNWQAWWLFIRRWAILCIACTLIAAIASYLVSTRLPEVYESKTKLLVTLGQVDGRLIDYGALQGASLLTHTYADLVKTRLVLDKAAQTTGISLSAVAVDAAPQRDTQLLEISVRADDPEGAARFANAVAQAFIDAQRMTQDGRFAASEEPLIRQVAQLNTTIADRTATLEATRVQLPSGDRDVQIARLQGEVASLQQSLAATSHNLDDLRLAAARTSDIVSVVEPATPSWSPVQPRVSLNVILAGIAGLLSSIGLAYVLERLDDRILSPERLWARTGLGALSSVPALSDGTLWGLERSSQVPGSEQYKTVQLAEEFRLLWTYLRFMDEHRPVQSVLVTSSTAGEGKTSTAANLAVVAARAGQRVLVIDADLRRPTLHNVFDTPNQIGLSSLLLDENLPATLALQDSGVPGLLVLPSGPPAPSPGALLASTLMRERMAQLRVSAELIIVDSAPALIVSDAALLATVVDGTLLVVDAQTRALQVTETAEILEQAGAHLLGVVLNRMRIRRHQYLSTYEADPANRYGAAAPTGLPESDAVPRR